MKLNKKEFYVKQVEEVIKLIKEFRDNNNLTDYQKLDLSFILSKLYKIK